MGCPWSDASLSLRPPSSPLASVSVSTVSTWHAICMGPSSAGTTSTSRAVSGSSAEVVCAGAPSRERRYSKARHTACLIISCHVMCDFTTSRLVSICVTMRQLPLICALCVAIAWRRRRLLASRSSFVRARALFFGAAGSVMLLRCASDLAIGPSLPADIASTRARSSSSAKACCNS